MAPGLSPKSCEIRANLLKPLRHNGFPFDSLITPTLKAAGSNPVGRTKMCRQKRCTVEMPRFRAAFLRFFKENGVNKMRRVK